MAFTRPEVAREINRTRMIGKFADDNEALAALGETFLNMMLFTSGSARKVNPKTVIPVECDLALPLIGAVALDSKWDVNTTSVVVKRILGENWIMVRDPVTSKGQLFAHV